MCVGVDAAEFDKEPLGLPTGDLPRGVDPRGDTLGITARRSCSFLSR